MLDMLHEVYRTAVHLQHDVAKHLGDNWTVRVVYRVEGETGVADERVVFVVHARRPGRAELEWSLTCSLEEMALVPEPAVIVAKAIEEAWQKNVQATLTSWSVYS